MKNNVLQYFKEISSIPRPSGHEEKICKYLVDFAKKNNLEFYTDEYFNIIIKKPSNIPNNNKTIILQSHTDMVCEKNEQTVFDFYNAPLSLKIEGDYIMAEGTTLGADNGVGVAMILAILSDQTVQHPNIEAVLTSSEETTMIGATKLDYSKIKGKHLLSLDGTREGAIETSSAGFCDITARHKSVQIENDLPAFIIKISGLMGGHSGEQINTPRKNANKILASILERLDSVKICDLNCNSKINAIPREANAVVSCENSFEDIVSICEDITNNNNSFEENLEITVEETDSPLCYTEQNSKQIIGFLNAYNFGVLEYDKEEKDFPITSCNIAKIGFEDGFFYACLSIRSSKKVSEKHFVDELFKQAQSFNFDCKVNLVNPFFEKKENPYLPVLCAQTFEKLYNKKAVIRGVHAGLEGGIFSENIPDIEICTISSDIFNPHSPMEKACISSMDRVYEWIKEILVNF